MKNEDVSRSRLLSWLCVGEVLTGTGLTLLGCILPSLTTVWLLSDARAGVLFTAQFAGASLGALLVSGNYLHSFSRGCWLLIAGALSLSLVAKASSAFIFFFVFGLGLGLTMTSISVLAGKLFPERRGSVLSTLNAYWGLGAVVCPAIAAMWTRRWRPENLFLVLAAVSLLVFLATGRGSSVLVSSNQASGLEEPGLPIRSILVFAVLAFLYVGVEACVSGWMVSYVHRLAFSNYSAPSIAASCFWIALLCSRALSPVALRHTSEASLLTISMLCAFASLLCLLISQTLVATMLSAACTGFTLGPIYPLCLAKVLALARDSVHTKWIFAIAGLGGALLPWLTGQLATVNASLRVGLTIPLLALGIMLAIWFIRSVHYRRQVLFTAWWS
jgi:FHS family glucose/mannose:H+ symporter-like MFS transporter